MLWVPKRTLVTPEALQWKHGRATVERAAALGSEVVELKSNRLTGLKGGTSREEYVRGKTTLAVVVASPSARRLQPIPPSADWQFHLAEGCPAHCQYCYLAGSLAGPPVTRAYANIPEVLEGLRPYLGQGAITTGSATRDREGTTYEASCYTDPLGIEHLTGSLAAAIQFFGAWDAPVQLRWTTKFSRVDPLLTLSHKSKTRIRFSVGPPYVSRNLEGGTDPVPARLEAMRRVAAAGYPVGLTIAPIMHFPSWQEQYASLLAEAQAKLADVPGLDLTVELITHRFTPKSKLVQLEWYPHTKLDLDEGARAKKRTKFGSPKFVYVRPVMNELRSWFETSVSKYLPAAKILYWT